MSLAWKKINLTQEQRNTILRMRGEGLSYKTIGHKIGVSKNFVHKTLKSMGQINLKEAAMRKRFLEQHHSLIATIAASDSRQIKHCIRKVLRNVKPSDLEKYEAIVLNMRLVSKFNDYYSGKRMPHIKAWLDEYGDMQTNISKIKGTKGVTSLP